MELWFTTVVYNFSFVKAVKSSSIICRSQGQMKIWNPSLGQGSHLPSYWSAVSTHSRRTTPKGLHPPCQDLLHTWISQRRRPCRFACGCVMLMPAWNGGGWCLVIPEPEGLADWGSFLGRQTYGFLRALAYALFPKWGLLIKLRFRDKIIKHFKMVTIEH